MTFDNIFSKEEKRKIFLRIYHNIMKDVKESTSSTFEDIFQNSMEEIESLEDAFDTIPQYMLDLKDLLMEHCNLTLREKCGGKKELHKYLMTKILENNELADQDDAVYINTFADDIKETRFLMKVRSQLNHTSLDELRHTVESIKKETEEFYKNLKDPSNDGLIFRLGLEYFLRLTTNGVKTTDSKKPYVTLIEGKIIDD